VDPGYASHYRDLYENHWWWRSRERIVLEVIEEFRQARGYGPILDVGCGDGLFFEQLRRFGEPEGVESDASLLTAAGSKYGPIHVGTLDSYQPGKKYGLILLLDVIEHVEDDVAILRRARELLASGGKVIVTVPALQGLWSHHDEINHHFRRYSRGSLRTVLVSSGFSPRRMEYLFQWTVPVKLAMRLREALVPPALDAPRVPPYAINRMLEAGTLLERWINRPLRLPFGSSLLAVADE